MSPLADSQRLSECYRLFYREDGKALRNVFASSRLPGNIFLPVRPGKMSFACKTLFLQPVKKHETGCGYEVASFRQINFLLNT